MRLVRLLFLSHLAALAFGLGGILIALPHPEWWAGSRYGADVYRFGMEYGGSLHIIFGAATMLAFGGLTIGWRRTLTFFAVTVTLALSSELIGTGTGWPFGNYEYTSGLGYKVLGRVPFTIPLSWFYVGFASYLLMNRLAQSRARAYQSVLAVLGGAYLLTVWDLVLDPAMAHESLAIQFWTWFETGPYFGMPLQNFAGWAFTAVLFMSVSRLLWRRNPDASEHDATVPFAIYLANMLFAMTLSAGVGLWWPVALAILFGIVPAVVAWRSRPGAPEAVVASRADRRAPSPVAAVAQRVMAAGARVVGARGMELRVEGAEHLPVDGPVLVAARHFHHLHDGCAIIATAGRPVHILVALDWVRGGFGRSMMERACRMARWPVILRDDGLASQAGQTAFDASEARHYLRRAVRESVELLRAGELLVVFPEGYPNIDPAYTPKRDAETFLPFRPGFVRLVELAQRDGRTRVPIVPAGFAYAPLPGNRWQVVMRFGAPIWLRDSDDTPRVIRVVEDQARALSAPADSAVAVAQPKAAST